MKKYMLAFIITIPILMVAWIIVDSAEKSENTFNSNAERSEDDQAAIPQETELPVVIVNVDNLKVRSEPDGVLIKILPKGAEVTILAEENGFYRISCQEENDITEGYVRKEFLDVERSFEIEEGIALPGSEDDQGETDMVSLSDILREIEEYKSRFVELYSSNVLSDEYPDAEAEMVIEEYNFPSDSSEGASLTVYSVLSGKHLRYEVHYCGETGNSIINYYLCKNFVWVSRQNNYYSSFTLSSEYSDILYSTMEDWIITDDAAYIMHDDGELEKTDRTQLENEILMPGEVAAIENEQRQIEKFYRIAEEDYGLSNEQTQRWFDIATADDVFKGGIRAIRDLIFDDIDGNGMTDMVIMVNEPEMEYMYGTGALYFYMNEDEPYCFEDEEFPFYFPLNICYGDLNEDGNVEIAFALRGTGNGGSGDWYKAILSYTGDTMERLGIPSDQEPDYYDEGLEVGVTMEPEPDTYTAYCSYLDESITFHASNGWDGDTQKAYLAEAPKRVGGNLRGFYNLQVVEWEGRDALQVMEYLCGEGGNAHCVGWAYFILVWDEQGNGSVADWWVEGNLGDSGLIFYSAEDLTL